MSYIDEIDSKTGATGMSPTGYKTETRIKLESACAEVDCLRAELEIRTRQRDYWSDERNAVRAMLIKKDKALRVLCGTMGTFDFSKVVSGDYFLAKDAVTLGEEALALTPSDLAGCVVVKQSEWDQIKSTPWKDMLWSWQVDIGWVEVAAVDKVNKLKREWAQAARIMKLIDNLRADEGEAVTVVCSNPDFGNGHKNECVIVRGSWTNWEEKRFEADSVLQALELAAQEKAICAKAP